MVIENQVIIELKAVSGINDIHISLGFALSGSRFAAQTLSYMKATGLEIGLIINFGEESLVWKRLIKKAREAQAR